MHTRSTSQASSHCQSILLIFLAMWLVGPPPSIHPETLQGVTAGPSSSETCSAHAPVTNKCVEAGLRRKRDMLRAEAAFQVNSPATHLKLAEILNQQGDPNGAIEEYRAAIQLNPALAGAYRGLRAVYIDTHQ